jgi:hypothetical protein
MLIQTLLLIGLIITMIVLFNSYSKETDPASPGLGGAVFGFSLFVGIATYCLALYYFQPKPEEMVQFLMFFTMVVILPVCLNSAAISMISIRSLRETLASA